MQALHVVMLFFIVELLLTFPLSSEYKKIFLAGSYDMWLAGSQFLWTREWTLTWQWEHRVLTTEPPENSLGRSLERDIERSTFSYPIMPQCDSAPHYQNHLPGQQSAVKSFHLYIHWMAKHNEHNFKLFENLKILIQQNLSILAKGELPGKEKEVLETNVNRLLF